MDREPMYRGKHGAYCFTPAVLHIVSTHEQLRPTNGDPRYCCICSEDPKEAAAKYRAQLDEEWNPGGWCPVGD